MDTTHQILYRIRQYIDLMGTSLTEIGKILGSRGKSRQAKISTANSFLAGRPRSFSLERVEKLSNFYGKNFLHSSPPLKAASPQATYGLTEKIEKASEKQLDKMLINIADHDPDLFGGSSLASLTVESKRIILRSYYRQPPNLTQI